MVQGEILWLWVLLSDIDNFALLDFAITVVLLSLVGWLAPSLYYSLLRIISFQFISHQSLFALSSATGFTTLNYKLMYHQS